MREDGDVTNRHPELSGSAQALLDAVVAIASDLDLHSVLQRIVDSARSLTGARYGALGVVVATATSATSSPAASTLSSAS